MGHRVEITGKFLATHSDHVLSKTITSIVDNIATVADDEIVVVLGNFVLTLSPSTLQSLNGELLHIKFSDIVNVTPSGRCNVRTPFIQCNAKSNISWYWKCGISQPVHEIAGVATVLFNQYYRE